MFDTDQRVGGEGLDANHFGALLGGTQSHVGDPRQIASTTGCGWGGRRAGVSTVKASPDVRAPTGKGLQ